MKNKKLILVVGLLAFLFILTGCATPMEVDPTTGKKVIKLITDATTFQEIYKTESWFGAILVWPLSKIINYLTPIVSVGWAIIAVTFSVNMLTIIFTMKANVDQQKMTLIQPEQEKINKKYEGKTDERSQLAKNNEIMALYQKHNINPLSTMLTMFIQMPVIFAIYQAVQRAEAVAKGTFLGISLEQTPLNGIKAGQYMYVALFVVMIITQVGSMLLPQYLSKVKAKKEAELAHKKYVEQKNPNQNVMYYSMIPLLFISISWPTAMTLYWIISSVTNIIKTLIIQYAVIDKKEGK